MSKPLYEVITEDGLVVRVFDVDWEWDDDIPMCQLNYGGTVICPDGAEFDVDSDLLEELISFDDAQETIEGSTEGYERAYQARVCEAEYRYEGDR